MQNLNKSAHIILSLMLASSTAAIHIVDQGQQPTVQGSIPGTDSIEFADNDTVILDSMNLRQRIALMISSYRYEATLPENALIGGIHLQSAPSKKAFRRRTGSYSRKKIQPLISVDLEGCIEPTSKFRDFPSFRTVNTSEEAFAMGETQGSFLSDIGADINLAPVVDLKDTIWGCRAFPGSHREVAKKACSYIRGLHSQEVMTTTKHFPGKTLTGKDPHNKIKRVNVSHEDLYPFRKAAECGTDAFMASHQISDGAFETVKPADASAKTRRKLREDYGFEGLIISDAISMGGLRNHYENRKNRYIDIFRTNDLVLNLIGGRNDTVQMINIVENAVKSGELEQKYIDRSARRLLQARGLNVRKSAEEESKRWKAWKVAR